MAIENLFVSKSLKEHYWRGAVGLPAYLLAFKALELPTFYSLFAAFVLASLGLYALRGCPVCWSVGLFNTSRNQVCPIAVKRPRRD